ncbi:MAG TPA: hypothetical protein PK364_13325, partial [Synergistaceae bacterium]|nr:hypothetical protein [Synergistaceae bacterium]
MKKFCIRAMLFLLFPLSLVWLFYPPPMERMVREVRDVPYITPLGDGQRVSSEVPRITFRDLLEYDPSFHRNLWWCAKNVSKYRETSMKMDGVSPREWERFLARLPHSSEEEKHFVYVEPSSIFPINQLFSYHTRLEEDRFLAPVGFLEKGRIPLSLGFLLLCLFLIFKGRLYRSSSRGGILVASPGILLLWDVITLGVLTVFAYGTLDALFVWIFDTSGMDEEFRVMGVIMSAILIPVMTFFITATGSQEVLMDSEGIEVNGMTGRTRIQWKDLREISVLPLKSVRKTGGILMPKEVTRLLVLEGDEETLRIMEPPLKRTKREILEALAEKAPRKFLGSLEVC